MQRGAAHSVRSFILEKHLLWTDRLIFLISLIRATNTTSSDTERPAVSRDFFARVSTVQTETFTRLAAQANDFLARNPQVDFLADTFSTFKAFAIAHCRSMPIRSVSQSFYFSCSLTSFLPYIFILFYGLLSSHCLMFVLLLVNECGRVYLVSVLCMSVFKWLRPLVGHAARWRSIWINEINEMKMNAQRPQQDRKMDGRICINTNWTSNKGINKIFQTALGCGTTNKRAGEAQEHHLKRTDSPQKKISPNKVCDLDLVFIYGLVHTVLVFIWLTKMSRLYFHTYPCLSNKRETSGIIASGSTPICRKRKLQT